MTRYVRIDLTSEHRNMETERLNLPLYTGPRYENPRSFTVRDGCAVVTDSLGETYYHPLHTIARIKEVC